MRFRLHCFRRLAFILLLCIVFSIEQLKYFLMKAAEKTTIDSLREHHLQRKRQKLQKLRSTKNSSVQMNKKDIKIKGREVVKIHCER